MRIGSAIAGGLRHTIGVGLQALLILAIVATLALAAALSMHGAPAGAGSVLAAKGHGSGGSAASASTIALNGSDQGLVLGSSVTFTTAAADLTGNEYALVYLKCVEGTTVVYGQLDLPATAFVLGGGSSPWWKVGGTATCTAYLEAYGTHGGLDTVRVLAQTAAFTAN